MSRFCSVVTESDVSTFREQGFVVLRRWFDPAPLAAEMDRAFADGLLPTAPTNEGSAGVEFRSVIMMSERTPVSLALLDALAEPAEQLIGRTVIPGRAKGQLYYGETGWH